MEFYFVALVIVIIILFLFLIRSKNETRDLLEDREKFYKNFLEEKKEEIEEKTKIKTLELEAGFAVEKDRLSLERNSLIANLNIQKTELSAIENQIKRAREEYERKKIDQDNLIKEAICSRLETVENEVRARWSTMSAALNTDLIREKERINEELVHDKQSAFLSLDKYLDILYDEKMDAVEELEQIKKELEDFRLRRAAINEAIIREKELQEKEDFYRICLSQDDLDDMRILEGITPRMRNRTIIPKLIWEAILQRPTSEMIKRVTGGRDVGGIYKVTYQKTGEAYIGKTTSFRTRWNDHVKTAVGLEKIASSTFHTRLATDGIENYTWEILEEVSKDKLSEREKYWIEFYGTKESGLNMKAGG